MILVDTNVLSELARPRPNDKVMAWAEAQTQIALSAITVEDISFGIARLHRERRAKMHAWFETMLDGVSAIYEVTTPIARASGELRAAREAKGYQVAQADMLIAATALVKGLTLATGNTKDFAGCGVAIINPFE